ncbi:MAG: hypothetical protein ACRCXT_08255 [Paraclostridium sp.]
MMMIIMAVVMVMVIVACGVVVYNRRLTVNNALCFLRREARKGSVNAELKILELEESRSYNTAYWVLRDTGCYRANKLHNYK